MKKIYVILLTLICLMGFGLSFNKVEANKVEAAAQNAVYTIESATSVSFTNAPASSSATFKNTYTNNKEQLISGKSMTLTLKGYTGYKISSLTLSMKSNKSSGAGTLSYTNGSAAEVYVVGSKSGNSLSGVSFKNDAWNGDWSTSYVNVKKTFAEPIVVNGDLSFTIAATTNSLYCESFTINYESVDGGTSTEGNSGSGENTGSTEGNGNSTGNLLSGKYLIKDYSSAVYINSYDSGTKKFTTTTDVNSALVFDVTIAGTNISLKYNNGTDDVYVYFTDTGKADVYTTSKVKTLYFESTNAGIKIKSSSDSTSGRWLQYNSTNDAFKNYQDNKTISLVKADTTTPEQPSTDYTSNINAFQNLDTFSGLYLYDEGSIAKYDIRFGTNNLGDAYVSSASYGILLANGNTSSDVKNLNAIIDTTTNMTLISFVNTYGTTYNISTMNCTEKVGNANNTNHEFYWRVNDVYGHADYLFFAVMYMEIDGKVYFSNSKVMSVNELASIYYSLDAFKDVPEIQERIEKILSDGGIL